MIDTGQPAAGVVAEAEEWIADERARHAAGIADDWF